MGALVAHLDVETFSAVDLRRAGVHRYCEHLSTGLWVLRWRIGSTGPVHEWRPGYSDPVELLDHIRNGGVVAIYNAGFDREVYNQIIRLKYATHWPVLPIEQTDCVMAKAFALSITGKLEIASGVLGCRVQKDMSGHRLMQQMAKPRTREKCPHCGGEGCVVCQWVGELYTWWDDEQRKNRLSVYCAIDVEAETEVDDVVPYLSAREREVWIWDQTVNKRGFRLDLAAVHRMIEIAEHAKIVLDREMRDVTDGHVLKVSQTARLVAWINMMHVPCKSVAKGEQEDIIIAARSIEDWEPGDNQTPPAVERAIDIRRVGAKTSTAKLRAMLACVCADERARGQIQYHGAGNGRFAGRLIQPHNLYRVDPDRDGDQIKRTVSIALNAPTATSAHDMIRSLVGSPMVMVAKCMRAMIVAAPGMRIYGGDFSNIEGRVNAFLANARWKLDAFASADADPHNDSLDLYRIGYCKSFGGEPAAISKSERQVGKVQELSLGYQGAVGAFISMAANYNIKPAQITKTVRSIVDQARWDAVEKRYDESPRKYKLPKDQWTALTIVVGGWRQANPEIVQSWRDLEDAAIGAVARPGEMTVCHDGRTRYVLSRDILWCSLPSNRIIAYYSPKLYQRETRIYQDWKTGEIADMEDTTSVIWSTYHLDLTRDIRFQFDMLENVGLIKLISARAKYSISYMGYEGEKKIWMKQALYGGQQCAHVVSGTARDVLVDRALACEAAGYPVILHVHDEVLTERLDGTGSAEELERILSVNPPYIAGMPFAAKAWEGYRYGIEK